MITFISQKNLELLQDSYKDGELKNQFSPQSRIVKKTGQYRALQNPAIYKELVVKFGSIIYPAPKLNTPISDERYVTVVRI